MKISDLLIKDRINLDIKSNDKPSVIRELARLHEKTDVLNDYDGYVKALEAREEQSSTGIGEGIAIPHAKTEFVKEPALAMGRKMSGIDYDSLDGEPATLFFMIAAPDGANNTHIETLARLSQLLLDDDFKEALEKAPTADAVLDIINKTEAENFSKEYVDLAARYLALKEDAFLDKQIKLLEEQYNFLTNNVDLRTTKDSLSDTLVSRLAYYRLLKNDTSPLVKLVNINVKPALNKKLILAGGVFMGLFLGILIAFAKEFSFINVFKDFKKRKN